MARTKRGTRKRRAARANLWNVQRTLSTAGRPWYLGRWAGTGRKVVRGIRRKVPKL